MTNNWLPFNLSGAEIPQNVVVGGFDANGSAIYVGRCFHKGQHLPAKVLLNQRKAFVSCDGVEYPYDYCELLIGSNDYFWQNVVDHQLPHNVVSAGISQQTGEPILIGRAQYSNAMVVGKVLPSLRCVQITFNGKERDLDHYEILVSNSINSNEVVTKSLYPAIKTEETTGYRWQRFAHNEVRPHDAVMGGNDSDGCPIYVGRAKHDGKMLVANIVPAKLSNFISHRGQEIVKVDVDILCGRHLVWLSCRNHQIPTNAVLCSDAGSNQRFYVGRGYFENSLIVGKISKIHRALFIPYKGSERRLENYEVLVENEEREICRTIEHCSLKTPQPTPSPSPSINFNKPCNYDSATAPPLLPSPVYPQQTYLTNSFNRPSSPDKWVISTPFTPLPKNAVLSGHLFMSPIYVCRAFHNGKLIPGEYSPTRSAAVITYNGQEIVKQNFEILTGDNYRWVTSTSGLPAGAVQVDRLGNNQPVYIGRSFYRGAVIPGKICPPYRCLDIAFNGGAISLQSYEILVK
ncbi:uncharacterized protein LOC119636465 [Glossina fuscipes]|uniref:Uncharacterized protein LOC119636465 n=1 Tax=Glossina fuscipes TaxID=7396 RepID=A0A9C5Z0W6_9MUSC|nr:uncharacterized protein LOC119636465 [Glossina fuscipes]